MEWIDAYGFRGKDVVDFGCGSGVLGIAAAVKGAASVCCVDNDPQALQATLENAEGNGVVGKVSVLDAVDFTGAFADVILANILAGTLVELAPALCLSLKPGGWLVLSGILPEQAGEVHETYAQWLEDMSARTRNGWVMISGRRGMQEQ